MGTNTNYVRDPNYCSTCYGAARKAGRPVKQTDAYPYPVCALCESRVRNGLIHYVPSNGTEMTIFENRCEKCRHALPGLFDCESPPSRVEPYAMCGWGILDRLTLAGWEESDSVVGWHEPSNLSRYNVKGELQCPALCLRFTSRDDDMGEHRDPPPRDVPGQMFFSDLDIPIEQPILPLLTEATA